MSEKGSDAEWQVFPFPRQYRTDRYRPQIELIFFFPLMPDKWQHELESVGRSCVILAPIQIAYRFWGDVRCVAINSSDWTPKMELEQKHWRYFFIRLSSSLCQVLGSRMNRLESF
ncbi:hypothetical protein GCM10007989_38810 [Devosia pacifica]|uniref:Uncharacterized protein n=1 Tax=Devosia pacifica TaxID=1335967 RepID=A0A918SHW6_9HYPH|nr:hypothetical protein GCM10007989_38810 [Devosia pacifica]